MSDKISYAYHFEFDDGRKEEFEINLDALTLTPLDPGPPVLPEWTRTGFKQCTGCPLDPIRRPYCPLAVRIAPVVEHMSDVASIDHMKVTVIIDERSVTRSASAQEGLSSLMGIIVATSGCPVTAFFKPMARFHLPFANMEETYYRAASMYMLGQHYRWQRGLSADLDMIGLRRFYAGVAHVNKGMADRIRANKREDGAVNAIVLLDMFARGMPTEVDSTLKHLAPLFEPYLTEKHFLE